MSKVVVVENVSLDGVMQAPAAPDEDTRGGFQHGGWAAPYFDEVAGAEMGKGMAGGGPMLLGRRTYEGLAAFWPKQTDGNPFTAALNAAAKHVVSTTLAEPLPWENSFVITDDVAGSVAALKAGSAQDITVLGSGQLVRTLAAADLVDEYVLSIHPLTLGRGARLFGDAAGLAAFDLVKSVPTTTGVIIATYRRAR